MQNIITVLVVALILVLIIAILAIRAFFRAVKVIKTERQGSLLYEIQNHSEPERLRFLYNQYINNLSDPDFDSLILRSKEAIIRNLKGSKTPEEYRKVFEVYQKFVYSVEDPIVSSSLNKALFQK